jgi:separase
LHASPSTVSQDTFWDQVTKFAILFIKGNRNDETSLSQIILTAFSRLVDDALQRSDKDSFLSGKGFVKFCEYWMGFAKKVQITQILDSLMIKIKTDWRYNYSRTYIKLDWRSPFLFHVIEY